MSHVSPSYPSPSAARRALAPYLRVKSHLKTQLARGRWAPGARMPSEAELVARFRVSRMTVNRALRELQTEGLVERVQGSGTFATPGGRVSATLTIRDPREEIAGRGHAHHAKVHLARAERAPPALARRMGLDPGTPVFHTLIVHEENGVPLQSEDRYVNPVCAPDYLSVDFTESSPTRYLLSIIPQWEAEYSIEASAPTSKEARLLRIERTEPCLVVVRRTFTGGVPVTLARLVHPGSRYQLEGAFRS